MAIIGGLPLRPKPLVLFQSITALPEKAITSAVSGIAMGSSCQ